MRRLAFPLLIALALPAAAAQPPREELARIEAEQQQREQLRDQQRREAEDARREIAEMTAQLAELNAAQQGGQQVVGERRLRLAAINAREAQLVARMGANQNRLSHLLGALQTFSRHPPPALFVNPRDARDAVRAAILVRAVTPQLEAQAKAFAAEADAIKRARRQAAAAAEGVFAAESDVAERAARIETVLAQKTALERSLTTEVVVADQQIGRLASRAAALRAVLKGLPPPPALRTTFTRLTPPVSGAPERRFGDNDAAGEPTEGWTWRTAPGVPVAAPAPGIVEFSGRVDGWNNIVIIAAGDDRHVVVMGLGSVEAAAGQSVAAGQRIGRMATGANIGLRSPGPELRLEIRKNGQALDPARFMQAP